MKKELKAPKKQLSKKNHEPNNQNCSLYIDEVGIVDPLVNNPQCYLWGQGCYDFNEDDYK